MTLTTSEKYPGLYCIDGDPRQHSWGQLNLEIGRNIYRSDEPSLWRKRGAAANDWELVTLPI